MLLLIFCLIGHAVVIPSEANMKNLKKVDPPSSTPSLIIHYVLQYRWLITLVLFVLVFTAMIVILCRNLASKDEKQEEIEEEIYLQGRKLLLPCSSVFQSGEKFSLSEEFEETEDLKEPKEMSRDTLIAKLQLSKT